MFGFGCVVVVVRLGLLLAGAPKRTSLKIAPLLTHNIMMSQNTIIHLDVHLCARQKENDDPVRLAREKLPRHAVAASSAAPEGAHDASQFLIDSSMFPSPNAGDPSHPCHPGSYGRSKCDVSVSQMRIGKGPFDPLYGVLWCFFQFDFRKIITCITKKEADDDDNVVCGKLELS